MKNKSKLLSVKIDTKEVTRKLKKASKLANKLMNQLSDLHQVNIGISTDKNR